MGRPGLNALIAGTVLFGLASILPAETPPVPAAERVRPNVLLVVIDTLRADFVHHAPYLQTLAAAGRSFSNFYAAGNWTLPSHVSLFTGQRYLEHNVPAIGLREPFVGAAIADETPTLAEELLRAGYRTGATTEGGWVVPEFGLARGFERFEMLAARAHGNAGAPDEHLAFASQFARDAEGQPFFLFVHSYVAHDYFLNDGYYHGLLDAEDEPYARYGNLLDWRAAPQGPVPPASFVRRLYAAGVQAADAFVRKLVERTLADTGDAPLLVVVTSDHGESFDEPRGVWMHGNRLSEEQLRIPLIAWRSDRRGATGVVAQRRSLVDVAPSLLEVLGAPPAPAFRGHRDLFAETVSAKSSLVSARMNIAPSEGVPGWIGQALYYGDWKYRRRDDHSGRLVFEACEALPIAESVDPLPGNTLPAECRHFRQVFAEMLQQAPMSSLTLRARGRLRMRLQSSGRRTPIQAVQAAFPTQTSLLSDDGSVLQWESRGGDDLVVAYAADVDLRVMRLELGGKLRLVDTRLGDLAASNGAAGIADRFDLRIHGLSQRAEEAQTPDSAMIERLRALGYVRD